MGDLAEHVRLGGLEDRSTNGTIGCSCRLGVSNQVVAPRARITVGGGPLLFGWVLPKLAG